MQPAGMFHHDGSLGADQLQAVSTVICCKSVHLSCLLNMICVITHNQLLSTQTLPNCRIFMSGKNVHNFTTLHLDDSSD